MIIITAPPLQLQEFVTKKEMLSIDKIGATKQQQPLPLASFSFDFGGGTEGEKPLRKKGRRQLPGGTSEISRHYHMKKILTFTFFTIPK